MIDLWNKSYIENYQPLLQFQFVHFGTFWQCTGSQRANRTDCKQRREKRVPETDSTIFYKAGGWRGKITYLALNVRTARWQKKKYNKEQTSTKECLYLWEIINHRSSWNEVKSILAAGGCSVQMPASHSCHHPLTMLLSLHACMLCERVRGCQPAQCRYIKDAIDAYSYIYIYFKVMSTMVVHIVDNKEYCQWTPDYQCTHL